MLAERAGLSRPFIARVETARQLPALPTLARIARALRVKVTRLLAFVLLMLATPAGAGDTQRVDFYDAMSRRTGWGRIDITGKVGCFGLGGRRDGETILPFRGDRERQAR